jgi:hypothetical protein
VIVSEIVPDDPGIGRLIADQSLFAASTRAAFGMAPTAVEVPSKLVPVPE